MKMIKIALIALVVVAILLVVDPASAGYKERLAGYINLHRRTEMPQLQKNGWLMWNAQFEANRMARTGRFVHSSLTPITHHFFTAAGECIAKSWASPGDLALSFIASESHRNVLMDRNMKYYGIGKCGKYVVVQVAGRRKI